MNIAGTQYDITKSSFNIFVSGCDGFCSEDCHNKEVWDFNLGEEFNLTWKIKTRYKIKGFSDVIDNLMIFGGEPLLQKEEKLLELLSFCEEFNKDIWLFTRFELDEIPQIILNKLNYVKTGSYIEELKTDDNIHFNMKLATKNQRIIKL